MTWPAAIVAIAVVALVGGAAVGYGVWMWRRARAAEAAAAVARAEGIQERVDSNRARALEEVKPLSDEELVKRGDELAARIEADLKRRGSP